MLYIKVSTLATVPGTFGAKQMNRGIATAWVVHNFHGVQNFLDFFDLLIHKKIPNFLYLVFK